MKGFFIEQKPFNIFRGPVWDYPGHLSVNIRSWGTIELNDHTWQVTAQTDLKIYSNTSFTHILFRFSYILLILFLSVLRYFFKLFFKMQVKFQLFILFIYYHLLIDKMTPTDTMLLFTL